MENQTEDVFMLNYKELTDDQKDRMKNIKVEAQVLWNLFNEAAETVADPRLIATAKTQLEIAVMVAVKGVTKGK